MTGYYENHRLARGIKPGEVISDQEGVALARATAARLVSSRGKTQPASPLGGASKPMTLCTTAEGVTSRHHGHLSAAQLQSVAYQKRSAIVATYAWTAPTDSSAIAASLIGQVKVARRAPGELPVIGAGEI